MISKEQKVPREKINYLLRKGKTKQTSLLIIKFEETEEKSARFRVIVSRKISNKAVKRNKIRRQIYEAIRRFSKIKAIDAILIPKKKILETKFSDLKSDIEQWKN